MQLGKGCITKNTGDRSLHPWTRRDLFRDSETLNEMWCFWVDTSKQVKESLTVLKKNMQILCDLKEQAGEFLGWLQSLFGGSFSWWVGTWSWLMPLLTPVITILMLFMISPCTINSPTHFISVYSLFLCCCKRMFAMTSVFSWAKTLLAFPLLHFAFHGQTCPLLQVSLDFLLLHSSPLWWKAVLFCFVFFDVLEGLVLPHRTTEL